MRLLKGLLYRSVPAPHSHDSLIPQKSSHLPLNSLKHRKRWGERESAGVGKMERAKENI